MSASSTTNTSRRRLRLAPANSDSTFEPTTLVSRHNLVTQLRDSGAEVVSVIAPAGYGKTTLLEQWAHADSRPFAWLTIDEHNTEPDSLRTSLARALDTPEPLAPASRRRTRTDGELAQQQFSRLEDVLLARSAPFVLVVDDVHLVRRPDSVELLLAVIEGLPTRSQIALAGRSDAALPLSRAVASGRVFRIGQEELSFTTHDCVTVLESAGVEHVADVGRVLADRTEGWPAGVFLAGLQLLDEPDHVAAVLRFAGNNRLIANYFEEEVLSSLSQSQTDFLVRASVLDILTGPLCDAILERSDSGGILEELVRSNAFVVPLDQVGDRYRYRRLFRDALRAKLVRQDRALDRALHHRASAWLANHGDLDGAIGHAHCAGATSEVVALTWSGASSYLSTGRSTTVGHWLHLFSNEEIGARPALALTAAWWSLTVGHTDEIDHWLGEAERAESDEVLPDGTPVRAATVLLHALVGRHGPTQVQADAAVAFELDRPGSPFRCVARYLEGSAHRLLGESTLARRRLEEGLALATMVAPSTQVHCLSQLALLALDEGAWAVAEELTRSATRVIDEYGLHEQPAMAIHFAISALCAARRAPADAGTAYDHAVALQQELTPAAPWFMAEVQMLLVRAALMLSEFEAAHALIGEAERLVSRSPDAVVLHDQLVDARRMIEESTLAGIRGPAALTPAELRVLHYLPTQLTFSELGEQLFVSRNTIKTQVHSVYRKLGVTSRTSAVGRARAVGLLDHEPEPRGS
jgi:LuxR family transcriptional regulator, maltose regulon positive regulatory protein